MRTRDKQNKHKLKFRYIEQLQILGKIWKEHCVLVSPSILKSDNNYNNEVVRLMSESKKKEYCSVLAKCDDIAVNINGVDGSLTKSHKLFSDYKKIISED